MTSKIKTPQIKNQDHQPVLLEEVAKLLAPKPGETYLDLTAGYGGHASRIIDQIKSPALATLVDRDLQATSALGLLGSLGAHVIKNDFAQASVNLVEESRQFDMILIDLGVSSPQLDIAERGFSLQRSGPLDMRMDQSQALTASELINTQTVDMLARIIRDYGEEPKAWAIARAIVASRPIRSTEELARVVASSNRGKWSKIHPATRTFQALRIAVNDELEQIKFTLTLLPKLLQPGGRVAIISFHSLEDRLVKQFLVEQANSGFEAELQLLTKKPISGAIYDVHNPRARSAMLRAAVKIKTKKKGKK